MQNPNVDSSQFVFIVTSYYSDNIYLGYKICENQIVPPTIIVKPIRTCTMSWIPNYYNMGYRALYTFRLSCSDVFRGDSTLYVKLPASFETSNALGTYTCSSFESTTLVKPECTLSKENGELLLSTSIDASSQSSLSLLISLVNPLNNDYTANAYVKSKGNTYANSGTSSLTILKDSFTAGRRSDVELTNVPKEAGLLSTYVFKIAPMTSFDPTNLGITFPSHFNVDSSKVSVAIANSANSRLFKKLDYNNIQALVNNVSAVAGVRVSSYPTFTVDGLNIFMTGMTGKLSTREWTYLFISNVQNPSAFVSADFTIAYYLISSGFQALQWAFQRPLTYYISAPPKFISINSVNVTDLDLAYPANYTFTIESSDGNFIGQENTQLSYIVVIPTFYKTILWANSAPVCQFAELNSTSTCESFQSEIIVTETFTANFTKLTLTISTLLNPLLPTTCDTTDKSLLAHTFFVVRIINPNSNTFLYESSSVVDSSNCLTFSAVRIPVSVEYSLEMIAGLSYDITFGLSKAASNLKIKSSISSSSFSFDPDTVDFNDLYTLTKSTKLYLRTDVSPGEYTITFTKSESDTQEFFRNILPVKITVVAANASTATVATPTIKVRSMVDSTVGYPVEIPIDFSLPSSTEMTLFMNISEETTHGSLVKYSQYLDGFTLTPRIINIQPQVTTYGFTLTHNQRYVPPPLTMNLQLTSNYALVHELTTPTMYICFDRDPRHNVLYPPLRVRVTELQNSCNEADVGKKITNIRVSTSASESSAGSMTPKIINMAVASVASTGASITINSISGGSIFYACLPAGSDAITDASVLTNKSSTIGVVGDTESVAETINQGKTAQINYVSTATLSGLSQSSNYVFYAVSNNNLGTSEISSIEFSTGKISRGVQMRLYFSSVITNLQLVDALRQVMRVEPIRIKILTSLFDLQQQQAAITANDNNPKYSYDVVIAPDATNDVVSPLSIVETFVNSAEEKTTFTNYLPTFAATITIKYFELRPVYPRVDKMPETIAIKLYQATFQIKFWLQANYYCDLMESVNTASDSLSTANQVIIPKRVQELNSTMKTSAPSSSQIKAGTDSNNKPLGKYKILRTITKEDGTGTFIFTDLKPQS